MRWSRGGVISSGFTKGTEGGGASAYVDEWKDGFAGR